jgi:serine/threonine protein phosphatase PrpC
MAWAAHELGAADHLEPQLSFVDLERGDCVLLCSDVLSNKVRDVEIHDIVRELAHSARLARDSLLSPMNVAAKTILP